MLSFISNERFTIKDHGDVFVVTESRDIKHKEMNDSIGEAVEINGKKFKCLGYEQYALNYKEDAIINTPFGILVGELDKVC